MSAIEARLREENETLREQVLQLREVLGVKFVAPSEWNLTRSETVIMGVLVHRELATPDAIMAALYGDRAGDTPDDQIISVFLHRMRRKLRPFGISIETAWGEGHLLNAEIRNRLKAGVA